MYVQIYLLGFSKNVMLICAQICYFMTKYVKMFINKYTFHSEF